MVASFLLLRLGGVGGGGGAAPSPGGDGEPAAAVGERAVADPEGDAAPRVEGGGGGIAIVSVGPALPPECTISTSKPRNKRTAATAPRRRYASGSRPPRCAMASLVLVGV